MPGQAYAYYVTAVDRLHNESRPVSLRTTGQMPTEVVLASSMPAIAAAPRSAPAASPGPSTFKFPTIHPLDRKTEPTGTTTFKSNEKPKRRGFFARLFGLN